MPGVAGGANAAACAIRAHKFQQQGGAVGMDQFDFGRVPICGNMKKVALPGHFEVGFLTVEVDGDFCHIVTMNGGTNVLAVAAGNVVLQVIDEYLLFGYDSLNHVANGNDSYQLLIVV